MPGHIILAIRICIVQSVLHRRTTDDNNPAEDRQRRDSAAAITCTVHGLRAGNRWQGAGRNRRVVRQEDVLSLAVPCGRLAGGAALCWR